MVYHEELVRGYRTVQLSGLKNMLDMWRVHDIAEEFELYDLADFINDSGGEGYMKMLTTVDWDEVKPYEDILEWMN